MQFLGREREEVLGSSRHSRLKLVNTLQKVSWQEGSPWGQLIAVRLRCW
jgi:hypothetical protein